MSINAQPPRHPWNELKEFIFASLIIAIAFGAGVMIYQAGDSYALMPVTSNEAAVINAY